MVANDTNPGKYYQQFMEYSDAYRAREGLPPLNRHPQGFIAQRIPGDSGGSVASQAGNNTKKGVEQILTGDK